jgi:hypothetical protein
LMLRRVPHVAPGRCRGGRRCVRARVPAPREDVASRSEARLDVASIASQLGDLDVRLHLHGAVLDWSCPRTWITGGRGDFIDLGILFGS